jgi:outer membrane lipoprotein-sorting protein
MRFALIAPVALVLMATPGFSADARTAVAGVVRIEPGGNRISYALSIRARWFPDGLRALVEIAPPRSAKSSLEGSVHILFEMRPNGQNMIRIARPRSPGLTSLPFDKWAEGVFGSDFSYEDFLESQYYWPGQSILKSARFGARECDVLKSTPGASDRTHYALVETWLDHTIDYPVYAEKSLKEGGTVKDFTYLGLRKSGGVWFAGQIEAKTHGRGGSTLLIVERGSTKANLTAKDFSPEQISHFEDRP